MPDAAEGSSVRPGGSVTLASRSGGVASVPGVSSCGSFKSKVAPVGLSATVVSGLNVKDSGAKRSLSQPVTGGDSSAGLSVATQRLASESSGSPTGVALEVNGPGSDQESRYAVVCNGSPVQSEGFVNIATGVAPCPSRAAGSP